MMIPNVRNWMPHRLKNRLIAAFLIIILMPLCAFQIFQYGWMEKMMEANISRQNYNHLNVIKNDFESLKFEVLRGQLLLEQNQGFVSRMSSGNPLAAPDQAEQIAADLKHAFRFIANHNRHMEVFLFDRSGSWSSVQLSEEIGERQAPPDSAAARCQIQEQWVVGKPDSGMMEMCSNLKDEHKQILGTVYVIFDMDKWLTEIIRSLSLTQDYFILDHNGSPWAGSSVYFSADKDRLISDVLSRRDGHYLDRNSSSVITYTYLPTVNMVLASQFHLQTIVGDLKKLQRNLFTTVIVLTFIFLLITYIISSTVTRPLRLLQKKMNQVSSNRLRVSISENGYKGEILQLCQSFNMMITDLNKHVERLKMEERQKEAIHFRMLLSQLNPHFLFNTLNTIKWNAIDHKDKITVDICSSLGKLLETSLNSEIELIHLKDELELIHAYLFIQQVRYHNRFTVEFDIQNELQFSLVPKFSLQPLVENAIMHGFSRMKEGGVIQLRAYQAEKKMILEVEDNGCGLQDSRTYGSSRHKGGIGLPNLKERLRLLYRDEANLEMLSLKQGMMIRLQFPLLLSNPYQKEGDQSVESPTGRG